MAKRKKRSRAMPKRPTAAAPSAARATAGPAVSAPRADPIWWAAAVTVGALVALSTVIYDPATYAPFHMRTGAPVLGCAIVLAALACVRGWRSGSVVRLDLLDALAAGFAIWQFVTVVVSPAPLIALFGSYGTDHGALFWGSLMLVLISLRRLFGDARSRQALVWIFAAALVCAACVAVAQAAGATSLWAVWGAVVRQDRVPGTLGNPLGLGALGLVSIWLLGGLSASRRYGPAWLAAVAGAAAGAACVALSVSRAAALGFVVGLLVLAVAWWSARRRADLVVLGGVLLVAALASVAYAAGPGDSLLGRAQSHSSEGGLSSSDEKRVMLWGEAAAAVAAHPLTGVGSGAFVVADRLYRPTAQRIAMPRRVGSDAHSLPLLVAAGSGAPGLILGGALLVLVCVRLWRVARGDPAAGAGSAAAGLSGEATLAYLLAAAVFAALSPLFGAFAIPAAVLIGAATGPPGRGGGRVWELGAAGGGRAATVFRVCGLIAASVALAAVLLLGTQWWRADRSLVRAEETHAVADVRRAAELWPWEPAYLLKAGRAVVSEAQQNEDAAALADGRALLRRGVVADPTSSVGYADLARLDMSAGELEAAVGELRAGLTWNPHDPTLEGLWAYAALQAQRTLGDEGLAARLIDGLTRRPVATPDGWFWLAAAYDARGRTGLAEAAREHARELGPELDADAYMERLK
jgi:O-antigen ligase